MTDGVAYFEKNNMAPPGDWAPFQSQVAVELFKKGKRQEIPNSMDKIGRAHV